VGTVAVIAHARKSLGGGQHELREVLHRSGVTTPLWYEVAKAKHVGRRAREALDAGADLVFVWGGDGSVRAALAPLAGSGAALAILPAGTANLLATNLAIPRNVQQAVEVGLHGARRRIDVGVLNGEHFAVMAGTGFDALMIRATHKRLKRALGRLAYVWTGARNLRAPPVPARVDLDGRPWFAGAASCVLVGNVGRLIGGVRAFPDARPDDGWLDVGVVTARSVAQWLRTLGRLVLGRAPSSPFVEVGRARQVDIVLDRPLPYELDGDDRSSATSLSVRLLPRALRVCVPLDDARAAPGRSPAR
jgi:YegS/Rv2252/BmrU family lipid kinase